MTPCIGQTNNDATHYIILGNVFSPNAKQTPPMARTCHAVWRMARLESRRRARQAAIPPRVGACSLRTEDTRMRLLRICSLTEREPPERKHLSRGRKRNQTRDSLSSSERNGNSPNRIPYRNVWEM